MSDIPRQQRTVFETAAGAGFDMRAYSFILELTKLLDAVKDEGTGIDTGTGAREADLWIKVGGCEFYITVRLSNNQLLSEGVTREQLGLPSIDDAPDGPVPEAPPAPPTQPKDSHP